MNQKTNIGTSQIIKFILIVSILSLIIGYLTPTIITHSHCRREQVLKDVRLKGLVTSKYIDESNHAAEVLFIHDENDIEWELVLKGDSSSLYSFAEEGDSLVKYEGSLSIEIIRNGNHTDFMVDYGCID